MSTFEKTKPAGLLRRGWNKMFGAEAQATELLSQRAWPDPPDLVPLCWAAATETQDYLNLGDALSAVMVAAVSGRGIRHTPMQARGRRLSAVGTIGHSLQGGEIHVWGTGCSNYANPLSRGEEKRLYTVPPDTKLLVHATRGPISWKLLTGASPGQDAVYGDPVWLLPRFYSAPAKKTAELGVIIHLSELADRDYEAHPKPELLRYVVPASLQGQVRLINTITPVTAAGMRERMNDILSCKRIISTSLHGLVFAESYGIPCLYIQARRGQTGLARIPIGNDDKMNLRMSDLYAGLGQDAVDLYIQPKRSMTDWDDVISAIDRSWYPKSLDEERLLDAFPLPVRPLKTEDVFDLPLIKDLPFRPKRRVRA